MIGVKEEFLFEEVEDYIKNNITVAMIGPQGDERSKALYERIKDNITCITFSYNFSNKIITIDCSKNGICIYKQIEEKNLKYELTSIAEKGINFENVLVDLASLQSPCLMVLLTVLFQDSNCKPSKLFAAYTKPLKYLLEENRYSFSSSFGYAAAIPGLIARAKENEVLLPFLGFEGARLRNIIGDSQYLEVKPIIGFPSEEPKWQFETLKYCMKEIKEQNAEHNISKCNSDSIFDAYALLEKIINHTGDYYVIAPLGTKPHVVAATIFAIKNSNKCRLIYDFAEQKMNLTRGIHSIIISHLSSFL